MKKNYVLRSGGQRYETSFIRRFLHHARTINWENPTCVYFRVSYGTEKDNFGKVRTIYNDGTYDNKKDFDVALKAFCE